MDHGVSIEIHLSFHLLPYLIGRQIELIGATRVVGAEDAGPLHISRLRVGRLARSQLVVRQADGHVPVGTAHTDNNNR